MMYRPRSSSPPQRVPGPPPRERVALSGRRLRIWLDYALYSLAWINCVACGGATLACAVAVPSLAVIAAVVPLFGLLALPALLAVIACLFLLVPAFVRLAFGDPAFVSRPGPNLTWSSPSPIWWQWPIRLARPLQNLRLVVTIYRTLIDLKRNQIVWLYLQDTVNRILRFPGSGRRFSKQHHDGVRSGIVYVPANVDLGRPAKRLDVYLPVTSGSDTERANDNNGDSEDDDSDKENHRSPPPPVSPVVVLLGFTSYRQADDIHSFPVSNLAHQLQSLLGVCVVVPALTPFTAITTTSSSASAHGETIERMVAETRECLKWVGENVARYGGDPAKVWMMGYGAGAHIASLTMVQSAVVASRETYLTNRAAVQARLAHREGLVSVDESSPVFLASSSLSSSSSSSSLPQRWGERLPPAAPGCAKMAGAQGRRGADEIDSAVGSDKFGRAGEDDPDPDEDEVERLLKRSRSARFSCAIGGEPRVVWADLPPHQQVPFQTPFSPMQDLRRAEAMPGRFNSGPGDDGDDGDDEEEEIELSDGIRTCRLFTLDSLENGPSSAVSDVGGGAASRETLPAATREPEFAPPGSSSSTGRGAPMSLASFELPPHPSRRVPKGKKSCTLGRGGVGSTKHVEVRGMILVEGTYDIVKQARWEHECGLEEVSSLNRLCEANHRDYLHACPSHLVYAASPLLSHVPASSNDYDAMSPTPLARRFLPGNVLLIHGGGDHLSPFSAAVLFRNLLIGVGLESDRVHVKLYRHLSAMGALAALMGQTPYSALLFDAIADVLDADEED
ncbi:hypothetical protein JCM3774_001885 [Rhodotorula dairenensis]